MTIDKNINNWFYELVKNYDLDAQHVLDSISIEFDIDLNDDNTLYDILKKMEDNGDIDSDEIDSPDGLADWLEGEGYI